jgi:hypothetical protein
VQFDAVQPAGEVEQVPVDLPPLAVMVAGDQEEAIGLSVESRQKGQSVKRLFKTDSEIGIKRRRASRVVPDPGELVRNGAQSREMQPPKLDDIGFDQAVRPCEQINVEAIHVR